MIDDATDAKKARERALNKERAARYRARMRHGRHGSDVTLHNEPGWWNTDKERKIAVALVNGASDRGALRSVGSGEKATQLIESARAGLAAALKTEGLTVTRIIRNTAESIEATIPMLTAKGSIERPDWQARSAGRRDAIQLLDRAGELPSPQSTGHGGTTIQVAIVIPQDVVGERRISEGQDTVTVQLPDNIE